MRQTLSRRRFLAGVGVTGAASAALPGTARASHPLDPTETAVESDRSGGNHEAAPTDDLQSLVDDLVETSLADHDVPGATVAVIADGQTALTKGYGVADRDAGDPVDPAATPFRLGSVSKAVTATALMRLVHRGDLEPDADVTRYLDVPIDDAYDEPVTLRHLVTHRAGFESTNQGLWIPHGTPVEPLETYLRDGQRARVRPPGEAGSYSNYGYALAGSLLAAATDQPFHAAIDDLLLVPAGMTTSSFQQPLPASLADAHATGHGPLGPARDGAFPSVGLRPAGSLSATATDVAQFLELHLNDGVVDGDRVLEPGVVAAMHEQWATHHDALDGMAFGIVEATRGDVRTLWHNGATMAFYSHLVLVPEHDLGFFIAYNGSNGAAAARDVVDGVLDDRLPGPDGENAADRSLRPDGEPARANELAGTYRHLQQSHTWHDRLPSVVNAPTIEVSVAADGALLTSDGSTTTRWVEREPLLFERSDGSDGSDGSATDRLAFGERDGELHYLFRDGSPTAYGRVDGLDRLGPHAAIAAVSTLAMLSGTLGWPTAALWRHVRRDRSADDPADDATVDSSTADDRTDSSPDSSIDDRTDRSIDDGAADTTSDTTHPSIRDRLRAPTTRARVVAGTAPLALLAFPIAAVAHLVLALYATLSDPPLTFTLLYALPLLGLLGGLASLAYAVRSWLHHYWTIPARLHYAVVALAILAYCWLLWYWNLLLPPGW